MYNYYIPKVSMCKLMDGFPRRIPTGLDIREERTTFRTDWAKPIGPATIITMSDDMIVLAIALTINGNRAQRDVNFILQQPRNIWPATDDPKCTIKW